MTHKHSQAQKNTQTQIQTQTQTHKYTNTHKTLTQTQTKHTKRYTRTCDCHAGWLVLLGQGDALWVGIGRQFPHHVHELSYKSMNRY